jgi:hypothetical protein
MKTEVTRALEELKKQFEPAVLTAREDGQGGAYVILEPMSLGSRFRPDSTWVGFQIPAQYPYADIYPVFIGGDVTRADGVAFVAPVTPGHHFETRPAIQISRRTGAVEVHQQNATSKILKVLAFLEQNA